MRIQHNIMAMNAYRNLSKNNGALSKNLEKLSSGYRINRAGDDAAGLAISEKMRAQIAGLDQAQKNAQSGINLVQTAEGALTEVHDMLNRMVTLATQAANGTYNAEDQAKIQSEINALTEEVDRISENSNFNGKKLLDGGMDGNYVSKIQGDADSTNKKSAVDLTLTCAENVTFTFTLGTAESVKFTSSNAVTITLKKSTSYDAAQIQTLLTGADKNKQTVDDDVLAAVKNASISGAGVTFATGDATLAATTATAAKSGESLTLQIGASAEETIDVNITSMSAKSLGIDKANMNVGTVDDANDAIDTINAAIEKVSVQRGNLGAVQNRLEHTINNLGVMEENIQDAEANIRDTDIADEMMAYTKNNILIQSAQAMLAQANQVPQGVLQLMQ